MSKYLCSVFTCLLVATTLLAQEPRTNAGMTPRGEAWRMSDEEHIVARTSIAPAAVKRAGQSTPSGGFSELIDGKTQPELLLPYELFDDLLEGLSDNETHRANAHRFLDPQLRAFGFQPNLFWSTLATVADRYLKSRAENRRLHRQATVFTTAGGVKTFLPINRADCTMRIAALSEARLRLGGTEFDHFLYAAVAPNISHTITGDAPDRAAQLRYMAGGCK